MTNSAQSLKSVYFQLKTTFQFSNCLSTIVSLVLKTDPLNILT